jgi:hypothetical protein
MGVVCPVCPIPLAVVEAVEVGWLTKPSGEQENAIIK